MSVEFKEWPKIPRYNSLRCVITEKIDGTNACVINDDEGVIGAQSRTRLITPQDDNYGFAGWVEQNKEELAKLGRGYHYGEWAGLGIQGNPLNLKEKTFFLFNTVRWTKPEIAPYLPAIVTTVPVLYDGAYSEDAVDASMRNLMLDRIENGQVPEGVVVYFPELDRMTKFTYKNSEGKWKKWLK